VLLFDGEMLDAVPAENHDQPVDAAATPAGLVRFSSRRA
jgi:5-formyltetrahydrofolate cyclo-ligase